MYQEIQMWFKEQETSLKAQDQTLDLIIERI
jgi:hypothetical protein